MRRTTAVALLSVSLVACGTTTGDRLASGAGLGALSGAAVGAVTELGVGQAVLIGAAAGALVGAIARSDQVNLGAPPWAHHSKPAPAVGSPPAPDATVRSIQQQLRQRGLDVGPVDGIAGPRTRSAISRYQQEQQLVVDGQPSAGLAAHIEKNS